MNEYITPLLIVIVIYLLYTLCSSTKESLCLCNGPQCQPKYRDWNEVQERVRNCQYPAHMIGVL